jgi:hypothetical protein
MLSAAVGDSSRVGADLSFMMLHVRSMAQAGPQKNAKNKLRQPDLFIVVMKG